MTITIYEDGVLYSDRALISTEAGICCNHYSKKLFVSKDYRFAVAMSGDEVPRNTEKALMRLVEDMLTLIYAMGDTDPYPEFPQLAEIVQNRGLIVMTRGRVFHVKRKGGAVVRAGKIKSDVSITEGVEGQRFNGGNCGPFYLVERALGTEPFEAIRRAVKWKMGKDTEVDHICMNDLSPFSIEVAS